jgi:hypothetical protein
MAKVLFGMPDKIKIRPRDIWTKDVEDSCFQYIAELRKINEVTDLLLKEFAIKWNLKTDNEENRNYAIAVRNILYNRVKYYIYDDRAKRSKQIVLELRKKWKYNLDEVVRESNKAARIQEYAKIAQAAYNDKQYAAAVQALLAIAKEKGEIAEVYNQYNQFNQYSVTNFENLTDEEKKALLEKSFKELGVNSGAEKELARRLVEGATNV